MIRADGYIGNPDICTEIGKTFIRKPEVVTEGVRNETFVRIA